MTDTVFFSNEGEMDILGATVMGVHVKEGENPIGHFGTGLKFAIATLLRTEHKVQIYVGTKVYNFDTEVVNIRGKDFNIVCMNGERLGFTTDTGRNWEVWMAYRELRCNAMDEPGWFVTDDEEQAVTYGPDLSGRTTIVITGEPIVRAHRQRGLYFCEDRILLDSAPGLGEIRAGGSDYIYYRGVAAMKLKEPSLFTYNIIEEQPLTEDRTLKEGWWIPYVVGKIAALGKTKEVLERQITAPEQTFEHTMDYSHSHSPSEEFFAVAGSHRNNVKANNSAIMLWAKKAPLDERFELVDLNEEETLVVEKALEICRRADPSFNLELGQIKVAITLGEGVLGLYTSDGVYIARNVINTLGLHMTAGTLLEEWVHKTYKFLDNSRSMQNYLLDRLMRVVTDG